MAQAKTEDQPKNDREDRGRELAPTGGRELMVADFGDDAGAGLEGAEADEFIIPMIRILQSNSPQCDTTDAAHVAGARPGLFINTATGELYDHFVFIPVFRDHKFPEFTPRNLGGGFVGVHEPDEDMVLALRARHGRFGKLYTSDKKTPDGYPAEGTEVVEQYSLYALMVDLEEGYVLGRVILPFSSTQIKKYKGFMSRVDSIRYRDPSGVGMVKPPLWAHAWRATTGGESNKKGKFFGWQLRLAGQGPDGSELPVINSLVKRSDPLYAQARAFYDLIKEGAAKADYGQAEGVDAEATEDEEIPM